MKIGTYQLTPSEESEILSIYEKLKRAFPAIKIKCRKKIIGIGEEGRYLMCYFLVKKGTIFVLYTEILSKEVLAKQLAQNI